MEIEYGHCHCGCGRKTNPAHCSVAAKGVMKGDPQLFIHGHNPIAKFKNTPADFWKKVSMTDPDKCWEWQGRKSKVKNFDYGVMMFHGKRQYTHRLAWILTNGEIEGGLSVLHKCDNPPCCNPAHLFLGTYKDNFDDMAAKKRNVLPASPLKLSIQQVEEIRRLSKEDRINGLAISKIYNVSHSHVCRIIKNETRIT